MHRAVQLSVIIPHLNEPETLANCLAALDAQRSDGVAFEIIVVDNGSAVMPRAVCDAIGDVRLEREIIAGPGPARNRGAAVAAAPVLAFIDADCVAQPGWVKAIVTFMEANPDVGFAGGEIGIMPSRAGELTMIEAYESVYSYRNDRYIAEHGFSATGNMAVRAEVFRQVGPFGGITTMEDTEWGKRASALGHRAAFLPQALVLTPSCKSFDELARRWDRHVAHEFRHVRGNRRKLLAWGAKTFAVAASPLAELSTLLRSSRLRGLDERLRAFACLVRVRLYRAGLMAKFALRDDAADRVGRWNREQL